MYQSVSTSILSQHDLRLEPQHRLCPPDVGAAPLDFAPPWRLKLRLCLQVFHVEQIDYRSLFPSPYVEGASLFQLQRQHERLHDIGDMDEIPGLCAVPVYRPPSLGEPRHHAVLLPVAVDVEQPQDGGAVGELRRHDVADCLCPQLGMGVWRHGDGLRTLWGWNLSSIPIHRTGRGKDELLDAADYPCPQHGPRAFQVHGIGLIRVVDGVGDAGDCRQMDYRIDLFCRAEDLSVVENVALFLDVELPDGHAFPFEPLD